MGNSTPLLLELQGPAMLQETSAPDTLGLAAVVLAAKELRVPIPLGVDTSQCCWLLPISAA